MSELDPPAQRDSGRERPVQDHIDIEELALRTTIGIFPEERDRKQDVTLHLRLYTDLRPAGVSDRIEDAINYKNVTKGIIALVESSRFDLIESLAEQVATQVLDGYPIEGLRLKVEKPGALRHARTVAVTIYRTRA